MGGTLGTIFARAGHRRTDRSVYAFILARRMRSQTAYRAELEDWLFHFVLPLVAYVALPVSALAASTRAREALFGVGGPALLLLFVGIHNAWDAVSYHVFVSMRNAKD